jgi:SAM-dependent methyltransferase
MKRDTSEAEPETLLSWLRGLLGSSGFPDTWDQLSCCPACGSGVVTPSFTKWGMPHSECTKCRLVFVNPQPSPEFLEELYQTGYTRAFRDHVEIPQFLDRADEPPVFSLSRDMIDRVIERAHARGRCESWLDVGGGLGWLAKTLRDHHGISTTAIREIDLEAAAFAERNFGIRNITDKSSRSWDVVSSIATLEHVSEPVDFIRSCAEQCRPGGTVIISVPNFTALNRLVSKASSAIACPPFHLSLFNRESLMIAALRSGMLEDIEIEEMGGPAFQPIDLVDHIDHFDVTIPREDAPEAKSLFLKPYDETTQVIVNCLAQISPRLEDWLLETDGRLIITLFGRRSQA